MRISTLIGAVGLAGAGAALGYAVTKRWHKPAPTFLPDSTPATRVRDAGPEAMKNPPRRWEKHDEAIDESFPASDPPGTY